MNAAYIQARNTVFKAQNEVIGSIMTFGKDSKITKEAKAKLDNAKKALRIARVRGLES